MTDEDAHTFPIYLSNFADTYQQIHIHIDMTYTLGQIALYIYIPSMFCMTKTIYKNVWICGYLVYAIYIYTFTDGFTRYAFPE